MDSRGTGESVYLTEAENNRISEIAADQNGGRVKNIMHVGAATTAQAARQAEHAAKAGVEAICAVPPFFYGVEDDAIVEYYRVVGNAADLPLFAYNLPHATGVDIVPELMAKIQDNVPHLQGLKHSSTEFHNVAAYVEMGLECFIGSSLLMAPALAIGAVGCIDGPLCIVPELWEDIWKAHRAGNGEASWAARGAPRNSCLSVAPSPFRQDSRHWPELASESTAATRALRSRPLPKNRRPPSWLKQGTRAGLTRSLTELP